MSEWYTWDSLKTAQACLDYINSNAVFPIAHKEGFTDKDCATKTERWADEVIALSDGKFGFKKIPSRRFDMMGVIQTASKTEVFLNTFTPTIKEFDKSWISAEAYI